MKKIYRLFIVLFMAACMYTAASAETLVTYGGTFSEQNVGFLTFLSEHPDISVTWPDAVYSSSSAFMNALLTQEFHCDIFTWPTSSIHWPILMDKGYCLDLSGSKVLTDAVSRMHPYIAEQSMRDGRLYAIPWRLNFIFLQIEEDTWFKAGLTFDDVPRSFPEFLDFMERWCDRIQEEPESEIRIRSGWEEGPYTKASYVAWLTKLLVEEAVMQMQYAGDELHFDSQELLTLLGRCNTVGMRIYQLESRSGKLPLFDESSRGIWPTNCAKVVFLRPSSTQPKLIKSTMSMWGIYASANNPEACIELLEKVVLGPEPSAASDEQFLYREARPRYRPEYESDLARWMGELYGVIAQLQNPELDGDAKSNLEETRIRYESAVKSVEENKWVMTPEQLADYQAAADRLYFPPPGFFDNPNSGRELERLIDLYSNQQLTARKFLEELDRIARMIRLEE